MQLLALIDMYLLLSMLQIFCHINFETFTASDGEFGCFSDQNCSSKPTAGRSLLRELNLATSDLTQRKQNLYQRIRRKESSLSTEKEVKIKEVERSL